MVEWHMHEFRQDALPTRKPVSPERQRMLTDVGLALALFSPTTYVLCQLLSSTSLNTQHDLLA